MTRGADTSGTAPRPSRLWGTLLTRWPSLIVTVSYLVSRWLYRAKYEISFDTGPVKFYIQYIDPWFMEHDFLRSLLYLHHQAPLQNVLVGLPVRWFGLEDALVILEGVYFLLGWAMALAILHAMLRLRVVPLLAVALSVLRTISPTAVIYDNWLFYHVPVTLLLVASLIAWWRAYGRGTLGSALLFFSLVATAALFRSTLGPIFLGSVVLLMLLRPPFKPDGSARKMVLKAAAMPMALLILNSVKPNLLIGFSYGDAMGWGNLVAKITQELPRAETARLIRKGRISPAAQVFCLTDLKNFGHMRIPHPPTGVPLLDMERTPNGRWNAHAFEYLLITEKYYKPDAKYLLRNYPHAYLRGVKSALSSYVMASTSDGNLDGCDNYRRLEPLIRPIDRYWLSDSHGRLLALMVGFPLLALYGLYRLLGANSRSVRQRNLAMAVAFMLLTIGYVTGATVLVSSGDFSRYRYDIDPFYLILFALLLSSCWRTLVSVMRRVAARLVASSATLDGDGRARGDKSPAPSLPV